MTVTLSTLRTPKGFKLTIDQTGMEFGTIDAHFLPGSSELLWHACPPAELAKTTFYSLKAAEFYMLAAATEYVEVSRTAKP